MSGAPPATANVLVIPDILRNWPFPRLINCQPGTDAVRMESVAWIESYGLLSPKRQPAALNKANLGLLSAMAYPYHENGHFRTGCDFMSLIFLLDDTADMHSAPEVRVICDGVMEALRDPTTARPTCEHVLGEIHRNYWARSSETNSTTMARRFIHHYDEYCKALYEEAVDRDLDRIRDIPTYIELRSQTIGAKPAFDILLLPLDIPKEVLDHPTIVALEQLAVLLIVLGNDIVSYNVEQSRGADAHNFIAVVMKEKGFGVQAAMNYTGEYWCRLAEDFTASMNNLPPCSTEKVALDLKKYIHGLGNWVTANYLWSYECERYFGTQGLKVAKLRQVELLPKV